MKSLAFSLVALVCFLPAFDAQACGLGVFGVGSASVVQRTVVRRGLLFPRRRAVVASSTIVAPVVQQQVVVPVVQQSFSHVVAPVSFSQVVVPTVQAQVVTQQATQLQAVDSCVSQLQCVRNCLGQ